MADVRKVSEEEWNGRSCPYFARYYRKPGFDPHAICIYGCREEPSCVTDEPSGGWPMMTPDEENE